LVEIFILGGEAQWRAWLFHRCDWYVVPRNCILARWLAIWRQQTVGPQPSSAVPAARLVADLNVWGCLGL